MNKHIYKTQARELSLQFLYQMELRGQKIYDELSTFLYEFAPDAPKETVQYVTTIVQGCCEHWDEINEKISSSSQNWKLSRISSIDKSILRIAVYEFFYQNIHKKIVINEAINLGKRFSTERSGSFINGVLDAIFNA